MVQLLIVAPSGMLNELKEKPEMRAQRAADWSVVQQR